MPEPGDFLVTTTKNSGWRARAYAAGVRWITGSKFNHAAIYLGDGLYLHSVHPTGVEITPFSKTWTNVVWSSGKLQLSEAQRQAIVSEGRKMVGVPYAPRRTILAFALSQKPLLRIIDNSVDVLRQPRWVRALLQQGSPVCSQLVDLLYRLVGAPVQNFRGLGLLSPADLHRIIDSH